MALVSTNLRLSFDVCEPSTCRWIVFNESTGVYDSVTNTGGWDDTDTFNPSIADVTEAIITVTTPTGVLYTFDNSYASPPYPTFPDSGGTNQYVITAAMLGSTDGKIPDGMYTITYTVRGITNDTDTYVATTSCGFLAVCQARCCVDSMIQGVINSSSCADCKSDKIDSMLKAKRAIDLAEMAASCGKPNKAKEFLAVAQWLCNQSNCSSC